MKKISYVASNNVIFHFEKLLMKKSGENGKILMVLLNVDTIITVYKNNAVMFYGSNADIDFDFWVSKERKFNNRRVYKEKNIDINKGIKIVKKIDYNNYSSIGSDEVGTGDYLAPIIVTAAYVNESDANKFRKFNLMDSKKMRKRDILFYRKYFSENIIHKSVILTNDKFNKKNSKNCYSLIKYLTKKNITYIFLEENKYQFN